MNTSGIINKELLLEKLQGYAIKIGTLSAPPVTSFYFAMTSKDTPKPDKLLPQPRITTSI